MARKTKVITGQKDREDKDLDEIISGKKKVAYAKFPDEQSYKSYLNGLDHFELCEELLRHGSVPSQDKSICIERCMNKFRAAKQPRIRRVQATNPLKAKTIDEIIRS